MLKSARPRSFLLASIAALLVACSASQHPTVTAPQGQPSTMAAMEAVMDQPGPVALDTIASADWSVDLAGLVNLKHPAAQAAGLQDRDEPIQVYLHVLQHPAAGRFWVDTGVSQRLAEDPASSGVSWAIRKAMHLERLKARHPTAEVLAQGVPAGVFLTHLHLDHVMGLPDLPASVPLYVGPGETEQTYWGHAVTQGTTDALLDGRPALRQWNFQGTAEPGGLRVLDVLGDQSVFALSVPGHTAGSVAFVVRTPQGPVLLTGDTCHTRWGWDHGVEPGDFTRDGTNNVHSLDALRRLAQRHPALQVRLGHQP